MNIPEISSYYPPFANQNKPQFNNPITTTPSSLSTQFLQKREVQYVKGSEGAYAVAMAPNSSDLFLDADLNVLCVVATDQNGNKSLVKGYHIGDEYNPPKPVTMEDLMAQMRSMNERLSKMEEHNDGQSNFVPTSSSESNGASVSTGGWHGAGNANRNANGNAKSK